MATKNYTFDDENLPTVGDITLELEYTYSYDAGRYSGPPEACYPAEEECEIDLPKGWEDVVMQSYINAARLAIKKIENDLLQDLIFDNAPREWAEEETEYYNECKAEAQIEAREDWRNAA